MSAEDFASQLREAFPDSQVTVGTNGRLWISMTPDGLLPAVELLRERFAIVQLAVIVAEDVRDAFLINYMFTGGPVLIFQVRIDRAQPEVASLSKVIPGAMVYEREMFDLFGINPVGHPDLRRQAIPEDWPAGVYPLRKDVQFSREGEVIQKEAK